MPYVYVMAIIIVLPNRILFLALKILRGKFIIQFSTMIPRSSRIKMFYALAEELVVLIWQEKYLITQTKYICLIQHVLTYPKDNRSQREMSCGFLEQLPYFQIQEYHLDQRAMRHLKLMSLFYALDMTINFPSLTNTPTWIFQQYQMKKESNRCMNSCGMQDILRCRLLVCNIVLYRFLFMSYKLKLLWSNSSVNIGKRDKRDFLWRFLNYTKEWRVLKMMQIVVDRTNLEEYVTPIILDSSSGMRP
mmetsp:Transcript_33733/g.37712  ORF Transcript_33733/g.37712 Transcript_33733/m.37712 type:complete len:247 (+) Transcript_33733:701-1441(+)